MNREKESLAIALLVEQQHGENGPSTLPSKSEGWRSKAIGPGAIGGGK